MNMTRNR